MRDYMVRFLKRIYPLRGKEYMDNLLSLGVISKEEYDAVVAE